MAGQSRYSQHTRVVTAAPVVFAAVSGSSRRVVAGALPLALLVAGCGGGGGVASAPPPAPTPTPTPAPANASLETLTVSQAFTNTAATHTARFDLGTGTTVSGSSAAAPLTIAYNAAGGTYTVGTAGRSQAFAAADLTGSGQGQASFAKTTAGTKDYLTLWAPSYGGAGPRYVALGFWQRNQISGSQQDTTLDVFTYGIETPAAGVPRTGTAAFSTEVFGVTTKPGVEPRAFSGLGSFDVDFQTGAFKSVTPVTETELLSGAAVSGGGIQVVLAGLLGAGDGAFSGLASYGGSNSASQGTVAGRFYSPTAAELGAVFSTAGADGSAATGGLIAKRSGTTAQSNLALTNLVTGQLFYTANAWVELVNSGLTASSSSGNSQLTRRPDGSFDFSGPRSDMAYGAMTAADLIAPSAPNFTTYRKTLNGLVTTVDFYTPGSANTQLALTYASFARFNEALVSPSVPNRYSIYTLYGIDTDPGIVKARRGTAQYNGIAYGTGFDTAASLVYAITGTASFSADFTAGTLNGTLNLSGAAGATTQNYGTLSFATVLANGYPVTADLGKAGIPWGSLSARFYGPTAQEIGAIYQFTVPTGQPGAGTVVSGAALAK